MLVRVLADETVAVHPCLSSLDRAVIADRSKMPMPLSSSTTASPSTGQDRTGRAAAAMPINVPKHAGSAAIAPRSPIAYVN